MVGLLCGVFKANSALSVGSFASEVRAQLNGTWQTCLEQQRGGFYHPPPDEECKLKPGSSFHFCHTKKIQRWKLKI